MLPTGGERGSHKKKKRLILGKDASEGEQEVACNRVLSQRQNIIGPGKHSTTISYEQGPSKKTRQEGGECEGQFLP